jgi:hypothetical protein
MEEFKVRLQIVLSIQENIARSRWFYVYDLDFSLEEVTATEDH